MDVFPIKVLIATSTSVSKYSTLSPHPLSHYLLWVLVVVAAPSQSPSAEEAEGQEEGGEEADHPEYRQGGCNTNIS